MKTIIHDIIHYHSNLGRCSSSHASMAACTNFFFPSAQAAAGPLEVNLDLSWFFLQVHGFDREENIP